MLRFLQKVRLQNKRRFDRIVGINVKGAFFAVQAVLPSMRKRKNGAIIIVGSDQTLAQIGARQQKATTPAGA